MPAHIGHWGPHHWVNGSHTLLWRTGNAREIACNPILMCERSESISPRPIHYRVGVEGSPPPVLSPRSTRISQVIVVQYIYARCGEVLPAVLAGSSSKSPIPCSKPEYLLKCKISPFRCRSSVEVQGSNLYILHVIVQSIDSQSLDLSLCLIFFVFVKCGHSVYL